MSNNPGAAGGGLENYQAALKIDEQIGNPSGQAQVLVGIGSVYFNQDKMGAALEQLKQARAIFLKIGLKSQLQLAEKMIEGIPTQH